MCKFDHISLHTVMLQVVTYYPLIKNNTTHGPFDHS